MKLQEIKKFIVSLANSAHHLTSFLLILAGLLLLYTAFVDIIIHLNQPPDDLSLEILDAVSIIVVAIAIFDVVKYVIEEAATAELENKSPTEARNTLTKFMVILFVAISLEMLVTIFLASKQDIKLLIYPSLLLVSVTLLIVGFGVYQKLSVDVETKEYQMTQMLRDSMKKAFDKNESQNDKKDQQ